MGPTESGPRSIVLHKNGPQHRRPQQWWLHHPVAHGPLADPAAELGRQKSWKGFGAWSLAMTRQTILAFDQCAVRL